MLRQRIDILQQGNVISKRAADFTKDIIDFLWEEYPKTDEEKAVMFITHLAMASQRVLENGEEHPMDPAIMEEIKVDRNYEISAALCEKIAAKADFDFPAAEQDFLIVHLCNLFAD